VNSLINELNVNGEIRLYCVQTSAKIVIIGAGAAGTALGNRLARRLTGAEITLIDPRRNHLNQPGLTLVATGLKPADYVVTPPIGCRMA
jgi:sulfide:quinone oxidoreductase